MKKNEPPKILPSQNRLFLSSTLPPFFSILANKALGEIYQPQKVKCNDALVKKNTLENLAT